MEKICVSIGELLNNSWLLKENKHKEVVISPPDYEEVSENNFKKLILSNGFINRTSYDDEDEGDIDNLNEWLLKGLKYHKLLDNKNIIKQFKNIHDYIGYWPAVEIDNIILDIVKKHYSNKQISTAMDTFFREDCYEYAEKIARDEDHFAKLILMWSDDIAESSRLLKKFKLSNKTIKNIIMPKAKGSVLELILLNRTKDKTKLKKFVLNSPELVNHLEGKITLNEKDIRSISPEKRVKFLKYITKNYGKIIKQQPHSIKSFNLLKSQFLGHKIELDINVEQTEMLLFSYIIANQDLNIKSIITNIDKYNKLLAKLKRKEERGNKNVEKKIS